MGKWAPKKIRKVIKNLSTLKGKLRKDVDLSKTTWFQVGGLAKYVYKPSDEIDLQNFIENNNSEYLIIPLGACSNVIIRDKGIDGIVIKLGQKFIQIEQDGLELTIGAGCLDSNVALQAAKVGLTGLEFLSTIPGTIGGGIAMNAGCYESEISDFLLRTKALRILDGKIFEFQRDEIPFNYRTNKLAEDFIFLNATFKLHKTKTEDSLKKIQELIKRREDSQPTRQKTGGSTFKNPANHKAWELIDKCGLRGYKIGGAQISEKHCNFIINNGNATASDIENLGEYIIKTVYKKTGVRLEWEIKIIGNS